MFFNNVKRTLDLQNKIVTFVVKGNSKRGRKLHTHNNKTIVFIQTWRVQICKPFTLSMALN